MHGGGVFGPDPYGGGWQTLHDLHPIGFFHGVDGCGGVGVCGGSEGMEWCVGLWVEKIIIGHAQHNNGQM